MFPNESRTTWTALVLLGFAAAAWLVADLVSGAGFGKWLGLVSPLLAFAGMLMSAPRGALNRTLPRIHDDVRKGREPRSTPLQKLCFVLGLLLVAAFTYRNLRP
ncbi:MAG TPA: hypothetical protein VHE32_07880 [Rhodanobacteraceae bacterium]|nr:hypothetical protein [Rhodanobacteraceae bacterium]